MARSSIQGALLTLPKLGDCWSLCRSPQEAIDGVASLGASSHFTWSAIYACK